MLRRALPGSLAALTFFCVLRFWPGAEPSAAATLSEPAAAVARAAPGSGARVEGAVSDQRGAPVASTSVYARPAGELMSSARYTQTDAQGRFIFEELPAGAWELVARVPRANELSASVSVKPGAVERVELVQPPQGAITGTLRDESGNALPGERLQAWCGRQGQRTATDERGRFTLDPVPLGATCRVSPAGRGWVRSSAVTTVTSPPAELTVTTRRLAVIRGRAVDEAGQLLEKVLVINGPHVSIEEAAFEVPARGRPQAIWAQGRVAVPLPDAPPDGADVELGTVVLRTGRTVMGSVKDVQGRPIADATFRLDTRRAGYSNAEGAFHLVDLPPEQTQVTVTHRSHQALRVTVAPGAARVDVTLQSGERVRGHVTWHDKGTPAPLDVVSGTCWVRVDASGDFVLEGLEPGPQRLSFVAQAGEVFVPPMRIEVVAGVEGRVEALVLPRNGRAVLTFGEPPAGEPVVQVEVDGVPLEVQPAWNVALTECRITRLPPGRVTVTVSGLPPITLDVVGGEIARARLP